MKTFKGPKYQRGIITLASASVISSQRSKRRQLVGGIFNVDEPIVALNVGDDTNFNLTNNVQEFL